MAATQASTGFLTQAPRLFPPGGSRPTLFIIMVKDKLRQTLEWAGALELSYLSGASLDSYEV